MKKRRREKATKTEKKPATKKRDKKGDKKPSGFRITLSKTKGSISVSEQTKIHQYVKLRREKAREIHHKTPIVKK